MSHVIHLQDYVFFADQGAFKTNDYEEMMNKASCLSFVSNAMVLWNTEQMQKVYETLKQKGFKIDEEDMASFAIINKEHLSAWSIFFLKLKDNWKGGTCGL